MIGTLEMESEDYQITHTMLGVTRVHGDSECSNTIN